MKFSQILTTVVLSAAVAGGLIYFNGPAKQAAAKETIFERVMRTKTLRCAYLIYPPEEILDPNTHELSGWSHDIVEKVGKELGLKIEWAEEVTAGTMFEGVLSGRFDALCSTVWESPERALHVLFTQNVAYPTYYPFVRADDNRFDQDISRINAPDVTVAVVDGEYGKVVADEFYPKAKQDSLPKLTIYNAVFQDIVTHKADVVFAVPATGQAFMKTSPGTLKMLNWEAVTMPASVIMLNPDEIKLKLLLDSTLRHLLNRGVVKQILEKYHPGDTKTNYYVAKPFVAP